MTMSAIRHIEFWAASMQRLLGFYEPLFTALNWTRVAENGFAAEGSKIYFREVPDLPPANKALGPRHICFQAENRETIDLIAKLPGVKDNILHGPAVLHPPGGSYMVVLRDPDGYILEVAANTD